MKFSTIPRVSARPRRKVNPYFPHVVRSKHKPHRIEIDGMCAYCGKRRAMSRDHVIPRSVLRTYNATAPIEAPSVPAKWLVEVPACSECNWIKSNSRLVPPSWRREVAAMNRFFGGTLWRTWNGDPSSPALKETHLSPAAVSAMELGGQKSRDPCAATRSQRATQGSGGTKHRWQGDLRQRES